jgi:hypothetical protein
LRPAWATHRVQGQPELHSEILSQKKKNADLNLLSQNLNFSKIPQVSRVHIRFKKHNAKV